MKRLPMLGRAPEAKSVAHVEGERAIVRAWIVGAVEDAGALRFARALAESLGAPLVRELDGVRDGQRDGFCEPTAIAVGAELVGRVQPSITIVIGGTLPRSAWRAELRGIDAQVLLAEPREGLAAELAARWSRGSGRSP